MSRATATWSEPFRAPRAARLQGRNLDLTADEDAADLRRLFGADSRVRVAVAADDPVTMAPGRRIQPQLAAAVRRLLASSAERLAEVKRGGASLLDRPVPATLVLAPAAVETREAARARMSGRCASHGGM
jgi:hypothetical protein